MELLIDKKYLIRLERYTKFGYGGYYNPFTARYVFALPKNAGLPDGYTIYIDAEKVEWEHNENGVRFNDAKPLYTNELEHDKTYRLDRPNNAVYVAKMTEQREEGKRYKQYKFTAEELYALYQNVDLKTAELAVAKIDIYIEGKEGNRHKVLYGNRIDKTVYLVGKVQGSWFYCSELDTKRRIGSHGVTILGKIAVDKEPQAWKLIREAERKFQNCKEEFSLIYSSKHDAKKAYEAVHHYGANIQRTQDKDVTEAISNVLKSAQNALQIIEQKLSEEPTVMAEITSELETELKKIIKR